MNRVTHAMAKEGKELSSLIDYIEEAPVTVEKEAGDRRAYCA